MAETADPPSPARRATFLLIAAFILLAPAAPQIFGVNSPAFRPWTMYSRVGVGLLQGAAEVTLQSGEMVRRRQKDLYGIDFYNHSMTVGQKHHIFDEPGFQRAAASWCAADPEIAEIAYDGAVSLEHGWRSLAARHVCAQP